MPYYPEIAGPGVSITMDGTTPPIPPGNHWLTKGTYTTCVGGQNLTSDLYVIPIHPGLFCTNGRIEYDLQSEVPSDWTLAKQAIVAYKNSGNSSIIYTLWDKLDTTGKGPHVMSFSLGSSDTRYVNWSWKDSAPSGITDELYTDIQNTDISGYKFVILGLIYKNDLDTAPNYSTDIPPTWYRPLLIGMMPDPGSSKPDDPTPPVDKPEEPGPCKVCSGPSDTSIATCIQATSQPFLDGVERNFRLSSVRVNSLNA